MSDDNEHVENEEQDDDVQLNPQEQNAHAEYDIQAQTPPPVQQMVQPATQREIVTNNPIFHTLPANRQASMQPIIPQMVQPHPSTPTRIPLIIPEKSSQVNLERLPFNSRVFLPEVSEDAEKFLSEFILFAKINQWQPSQTANFFKLSVDSTARI